MDKCQAVSAQAIPAGKLCFIRVSENGQRCGMLVHKFCPSYSILSVLMSLSWTNELCSPEQTLQSTLWLEASCVFFPAACIARAFSELCAFEHLWYIWIEHFPSCFHHFLILPFSHWDLELHFRPTERELSSGHCASSAEERMSMPASVMEK